MIDLEGDTGVWNVDFHDERGKKEIKNTFHKYVSPAIVYEILAGPSNI